MSRGRHAARSKHDPEWAARRRAAAYLAVYLKRGTVTRGACGCGSADTIAVQPDPAEPLRVSWICRRCASAPIEEQRTQNPIEAFAVAAGGMAAALDRLTTIDPAVFDELAQTVSRRHHFMNPGSPMHRQAILRLALERRIL
jgi:hypothetical protein